jgi:hypothetical protein
MFSKFRHGRYSTPFRFVMLISIGGLIRSAIPHNGRAQTAAKEVPPAAAACKKSSSEWAQSSIWPVSKLTLGDRPYQEWDIARHQSF